jgi:hypothetical protein
MLAAAPAAVVVPAEVRHFVEFLAGASLSAASRRLATGSALPARSFRRPLGLVLALEQRIALQRLAQLLLELERRQLQQADRQAQLRRQRQLLPELDLQRGFHAASVADRRGRWDYRRNDSPR